MDSAELRNNKQIKRLFSIFMDVLFFEMVNFVAIFFGCKV